MSQFISNSTWSSGQVDILTYKLEELLGTKMRALYQRRKGRDLYDLHMVLTKFAELKIDDIVHSFLHYMSHAEQSVTKKEFLDNMAKKLQNKKFLEDMLPLLPQGSQSFDPESAYEYIKKNLLEKLP